MFLKEAFERTDFVNKFNTGMENINAMSMNPMTKASCLKKGMEAVDLATIFGKRGITCG